MQFSRTLFLTCNSVKPATTSGPQKSGLSIIIGRWSLYRGQILTLLGHDQVIFIEMWSLDTSGPKAGFTVCVCVWLTLQWGQQCACSGGVDIAAPENTVPPFITQVVPNEIIICIGAE